jgi:hypothetical protein
MDRNGAVVSQGASHLHIDDGSIRQDTGIVGIGFNSHAILGELAFVHENLRLKLFNSHGDGILGELAFAHENLRLKLVQLRLLPGRTLGDQVLVGFLGGLGLSDGGAFHAWLRLVCGELKF